MIARPASSGSLFAGKADARSGKARRRASAFAGTGPAASRDGLRQLLRLRMLAIGGQVIAIALALAAGIALPLVPLAATLALLIAFCYWTWRRLQTDRNATAAELAFHLAADLAAFTALLACAGGLHNPFAILFLLHVALVTLLLPAPLAVAGTGAAFVCVLALAWVAPLHRGDGEAVSTLALGAGTVAAYGLAAAVLAAFIMRIVSRWRDDERELAAVALHAQNSAAVMRIGAMAAGAAHELATPLTTIAVIAGELKRNAQTPEALKDAQLLTAQVDACRATLGSMSAVADHARETGSATLALDAWLDAVVGTFRATRPDVPLAVRFDGARPGPAIVAEPTLKQSLLILLNNAADASPHDVAVTADWDADTFNFAVADRGPGFAPAQLRRVGRTFFTTKPPGKGTGLGLVLTTATVERFGGDVGWSNRPDGGALASLRLPLRLLFPERSSAWTA
jgi:two-component system sensor histidine kinase RegB